MNKPYSTTFKIYGTLYAIYFVLWFCVVVYAYVTAKFFDADAMGILAAMILPAMGAPLPFAMGLTIQALNWLVHRSKNKPNSDNPTPQPTSYKKVIIAILLFGIVPMICIYSPIVTMRSYINYSDYIAQQDFDAFQQANIVVSNPRVDFDNYSDRALVLTINSDMEIKKIYSDLRLTYITLDNEDYVGYSSTFDGVIKSGSNDFVLIPAKFKVPCNASTFGDFYFEYSLKGNIHAKNNGTPKIIKDKVLLPDLELSDFAECR